MVMHRFRLSLLAAAFLIAVSPEAYAFSRIKDLTDIEGMRSNMLMGYGLVVGLTNTGDSVQNAPFTKQAMQTMLERLGVNTRGATVNTKDVAAVMVTASLPPFAAQGGHIDVTVAAMGDAKSLQGGSLLATPLLGADGEVYALAQGSVAIGGFSAQGAAASVTRGVPTSGRIANGGIVEREIPFNLTEAHSLRLSLRNPDFTTAQRMASAINRYLGQGTAAIVTDPATVKITRPDDYKGNIVSLMTEIEQLKIEPDVPAKVIIDENSGVIVMGSDVRISTVAIAQGNLTISVTETPQVSQPQPFGQGQTQVVPRTDIMVDEDMGKKLILLNNGVSLQDLVNGLNALGIGPRDMISILQAIKSAGALQAEIQVM